MSDRAGQGKTATGLLSGSVWMVAARWAMRLIGLVSTMILARILSPQDFGLVAMVMIAYGLFETLSYASVDLALMRAGHESRAHFDTAWTIQILQGLFVAVSVVAVAPLAARYFDEPRLPAVMLAVAPKALIESLQNIGVVHFRKDLDFAKEFRYSLYNKLLGFVFTIGAAFWLRDYWALVIGHLAAAMVLVATSYAMHPYRPRLSLAKVRELWSFSQWLMVARFGSYLNRKCDTFLLGGAVGAKAVGSYHVAAELASLPSSELVMPIRRALFPTLSKLSDDAQAFARAAADSLGAVATLCLYVSTMMWIGAAEFTTVVLGSKWHDAIPLVQTLAIYAAASSLVLVLEVPLWVAGRTRLAAAQAWLELALLVPLVIVGIRLAGAPGAAAARAALGVAMVPVMMALTVRAGHLGWSTLIGAIWRPVLAALLAAGVVQMLVGSWASEGLLALLVLLAKTLLGTAVFVAGLAVLWLLGGRPVSFESSAVQAAGRLVDRMRSKT